MKDTIKESEAKERQVDDSKALVRPLAYEMKHYPHDGILQQLAFMLIRPPRFNYNPDILIPSKKLNQQFKMEIFQIPFELTLYTQQAMRYVVLYLHGNGSSRFQGTLFLSSLPEGVGLACFDFQGCGIRTEGQYITLGQSQCKDVDIAAIFLKSRGYLVVGWGRSMGAVSLLMSNECDLMVCDSAYANLSVLCKQSSSKFLPKACCCLFHCLFPCVFACIKCKVQSLAELSIQEMDIIQRVAKIDSNKRICFIHGELDTLVPFHNAQQLFDSFKGKKMIKFFDGTHNSTRPAEIISNCFQFIEEWVLLVKRKGVTSNSKMIEMVTMRVTSKQCGKKENIDQLQKQPFNYSANEILANQEHEMLHSSALGQTGLSDVPLKYQPSYRLKKAKNQDEQCEVEAQQNHLSSLSPHRECIPPPIAPRFQTDKTKGKDRPQSPQ